MSDLLESALRQSVEVLAEIGVDFAVVGGMAVSVRAEVRFTQDVDIVVAVRSDDGAEQLVHELTQRGYRATAIVEQKETTRLATARLISPSKVIVDLIFATTGIELQIVEHATHIRMDEELSVPFSGAEELLAMKVLSMVPDRPQDEIDARNLLAYNSDIDLDRVRMYLQTMTTRRFHRGQNLENKLSKLLAPRS